MQVHPVEESRIGRNIIYYTLMNELTKYLFIHSLQCPNRIVAGKELAAMAISRFDLPGDPDFPRELNNMYAKPKNSTELEAMRGYLTQLRQELGVRLIDKVYSDDNISFWWSYIIKRIQRNPMLIKGVIAKVMSCHKRLLKKSYVIT
ncbi:unnamed protein product [Trichobilharzia regenti]|nr:unnamed protein product [Trichobilharzia regenti]